MKETAGKRLLRTKKNRDAILTAAHMLFNEVGYEQTTIADIQRITGLTTGSIYHLFQNKYDILRATYQQYTSKVENLTDNLESKLENPVEQIMCFISQFEQQWMAAGQGVGAAIYKVHMEHGFHPAKETSAYGQNIAPLDNWNIREELLYYITVLYQRGRLRNGVSPEHAVDCILLFARGLILSWSFSKEEYDLEKHSEPLWKIFLPSLFAEDS